MGKKQKNPPIDLNRQDRIYAVKYFKKHFSADIAQGEIEKSIQTLDKVSQTRIKAAIRKNRSRSNKREGEKTVTIKLSQDTHQKLIEFAEQKGISVSEAIEVLLRY